MALFLSNEAGDFLSADVIKLVEVLDLYYDAGWCNNRTHYSNACTDQIMRSVHNPA